MPSATVLLSSVVLASFILQLADGHGAMVKPYTWSDPGPVDIGKNCYWYTNYTEIPGERTLDASMRTHPQLEEYGDKENDMHPWMAPGSAPVHSPCGALGGNPLGPVGSSEDIFDNAGWSYGPLAEDYYVSPGFQDVVTTEWKAGSVVEATWSLSANHGGGYSYRPGSILAIHLI